MADPKPAEKGNARRKQPFQAQVDGVVGGLQILPAAEKENAAAQGKMAGEKPALISKLIEFIKAM